MNQPRNKPGEELAALLFAVQMLTRVPIPASLAFSEERQKNAIGYYAFAGAGVGLFTAAIWWGALLVFPASIAVLLSMLAGLLLTGAFHEDGLADTMDGLGGRDATASLSIMRDSRIGAYGAVALISALGVKAAALLALPGELLPMSLLAAHCGSRFSAVCVVATSSYAGSETNTKPTARGIDTAGMIKSVLTVAVVFALTLTAIPASALIAGIAGLLLGHGASRLLYERKLRGYTGDCLGATQQFSELGLYFGLLAAL